MMLRYRMEPEVGAVAHLPMMMRARWSPRRRHSVHRNRPHRSPVMPPVLIQPQRC